MPDDELETGELVPFPNEYLEKGEERKYRNTRPVIIDVDYSADQLRTEVNAQTS